MQASSSGRFKLMVGEREHEAASANALTGAATYRLKCEDAAALLGDLRVCVSAPDGRRMTRSLTASNTGAPAATRIIDDQLAALRAGKGNGGNNPHLRLNQAPAGHQTFKIRDVNFIASSPAQRDQFSRAAHHAKADRALSVL